MKDSSILTDFQIVSDLHIEYKSTSVPDPLSLITPVADNLILAGDIGSFYQFDQLKNFLIPLCKLFKTVIYIPGNHEYYTMKDYKPQTMSELLDRFYSLTHIITNLHILNRDLIQINDVCIVGCTLWSKWTPEINKNTNRRYNIPKFIVRIHDMTTQLYDKLHNDDLTYIKEVITLCQRTNTKLLVVTHHSPMFLPIKKDNKFKTLYASNLEYLLHKRFVHTWVFGHIHKNFDFYTSCINQNGLYPSEGGTHIFTNQYGKPKDNITDYSKKAKIRL